MSENDGPTVARLLYDHPRLTAVLFTLAVLLTQVQPVLADCGSSSCGG